MKNTKSYLLILGAITLFTGQLVLADSSFTPANPAQTTDVTAQAKAPVPQAPQAAAPVGGAPVNQAPAEEKKDEDEDATKTLSSVSGLVFGPAGVIGGQGKNNGAGGVVGYSYYNDGMVVHGTANLNGLGNKDPQGGGTIGVDLRATNLSKFIAVGKSGNVGLRVGVNGMVRGNLALGKNQDNSTVYGDFHLAPTLKLWNDKDGQLAVGCYFGAGAMWTDAVNDKDTANGGVGFIPCTGGTVYMDTKHANLTLSGAYGLNIGSNKDRTPGFFQGSANLYIPVETEGSKVGYGFYINGSAVAMDGRKIIPGGNNGGGSTFDTSPAPAYGSHSMQADIRGDAGFMVIFGKKERSPSEKAREDKGPTDYPATPDSGPRDPSFRPMR